MRRTLKFFVIAALATACSDPTATPVTASGDTDAPLASSTADLEAPHYTPALLPQLPHATWSAALAINASGVAVGVSEVPVEWRFIGEGGAMPCRVPVATVFRAYDATSLQPALQQALGMTSPCGVASIALDVNDREEVVGVTWRPGEFGYDYGFVWSKAGGVKLFKALGATVISAINNNSVAVGYFDRDGYNTPDLVYWRPNGGGSTPSVPFSRVMWSWDISNDGVVSGCWNYFAFKMDFAGRLETNEEYCNAQYSLHWIYDQRIPKTGGINASGVAVYSNAQSVPVMWGGGRSKGVPVGWAPGAATGISDRNRIVGWRTSTTAPLHLAMTRSAGGRVLSLPGLPAGSATEAYAVNRCGHVVGATFDASNTSRAMLWKLSRCDTP